MAAKAKRQLVRPSPVRLEERSDSLLLPLSTSEAQELFAILTNSARRCHETVLGADAAHATLAKRRAAVLEGVADRIAAVLDEPHVTTQARGTALRKEKV